jgi:tetratricopeptide (TPR) repeat protein
MTRPGRNDPCPCGSGKKFKHCCADRQSWSAAPAQTGRNTLQAMLQTAITHHQAGHLAQAEQLCQQILSQSPRHADALHMAGLLAHQRGAAARAVELIGQAIAANPAVPAYHSNLGLVLKQQGRLIDAVTSLRRALQLQPDLVEVHYNLGLTLLAQGRADEATTALKRALALQPEAVELHRCMGDALEASGKLDEAVASYRRALTLQPDLVEAHGNLGNVLHQQGKLEEALACYRQALALSPDLAGAHYNLGLVLNKMGRLDEAVASYRQGLALAPDFAAAYGNLGGTLQELGRLEEALACYLRALRLAETDETKAAFAHCIKDAPLASATDELRKLLARAIAEAWSRPSGLLASAKNLLRLQPALAAALTRAADAWPTRLSAQELCGEAGIALLTGDALLTCLLENLPISGVDFERLLTMVRHVALQSTLGAEPATSSNSADELAFYCALARQCFLNEYLYACTAEEAAQAVALHEQVVARLAARQPVPAAWLAVLAAYSPLHALPCAADMLQQDWPQPLAALLAQQVLEPAQEREYRDRIRRLTPISDGISRLVQEQYEESPYPKWLKAISTAKALTLDDYLGSQFPAAAFRPYGSRDALDILVAGCGTGQHPVQTARQFCGARVLAIDLSLSSLCYALRMTVELGLQNIEYAQADIMQLGELPQRFDVIESVGVLHHLADPVAGWRVLLGLLRPGGFMHIGLYSEFARQEVVACRQLIAERGYAAHADDIRRFRQELMADTDREQFRQLLAWGDFYSLSECRDLLFHVQEHRFILPQLRQLLVTLGLDFVGFTLKPGIAGQYLARFPGDPCRTNLDNWQQFETEHPHLFENMYQFWVQKAA